MSIPPPPPPSSDRPNPGFGSSGFGSPTPPPPPSYGGPGSNIPSYGGPAFGQTPPGYQPYGGDFGGRPNYAGFGSRLGALIIDGLIGFLFAIPAIIAFFAVPKERRACTVNGEPGTCKLPTGAGWAIIVILGIALTIAYFVIYCRKVGKGQSWGMQAVGNRVVSRDSGQPIGTGRAVGRFFARYVSGLVCYLGYLWMLWDKEKQTWHDKIVGTIVVKA